MVPPFNTTIEPLAGAGPPVPAANPLFRDLSASTPAPTGSMGLMNDIFGGISGFFQGAADLATSFFGSAARAAEARAEFERARKPKQTDTRTLLIGGGILIAIILLVR